MAPALLLDTPEVAPPSETEQATALHPRPAPSGPEVGWERHWPWTAFGSSASFSQEGWSAASSLDTSFLPSNTSSGLPSFITSLSPPPKLIGLLWYKTLRNGVGFLWNSQRSKPSDESALRRSFLRDYIWIPSSSWDCWLNPPFPFPLGK